MKMAIINFDTRGMHHTQWRAHKIALETTRIGIMYCLMETKEVTIHTT